MLSVRWREIEDAGLWYLVEGTAYWVEVFGPMEREVLEALMSERISLYRSSAGRLIGRMRDEVGGSTERRNGPIGGDEPVGRGSTQSSERTDQRSVLYGSREVTADELRILLRKADERLAKMTPSDELTRDDLLVLLIEECSEVIQAATKCQRFGFDVDSGVGYGRNDLHLAREAGELVAIADALKLDGKSWTDGYVTKIARARVAKRKYGQRQNHGAGQKD